MNCQHPNCTNEATFSIETWVNANHMRIDYYCLEHAPSSTTTFEEDDEDDDMHH